MGFFYGRHSQLIQIAMVSCDTSMPRRDGNSRKNTGVGAGNVFWSSPTANSV